MASAMPCGGIKRIRGGYNDTNKMKRLNVFVTESELEIVKTAQKCSGMFLSGGMPMGDPAGEVERLRQKYNQPEGTGLDTSNGEFVSP